MSEGNTDAPDGYDHLRALLTRGLKAPMGQTLNFHLVEVERGQVVFEGAPDRSVYNPLGAVHGGYAATLLDSSCGVAVHSALGPGRGYTTLEVSYLRGLSDRSGTGARDGLCRVERTPSGVRGGLAPRRRGSAVRDGDIDLAGIRRRTRRARFASYRTLGGEQVMKAFAHDRCKGDPARCDRSWSELPTTFPRGAGSSER